MITAARRCTSKEHPREGLRLAAPCQLEAADPQAYATNRSRNKLDKQTSGDTQGAGIWGDSLGAISHMKLSQVALRQNPPVSLVPTCIPASWFP